MFNMKISYLGAAAAVLALSACNSYPVRTDVNPKLSLARCHSFGWFAPATDERGAFGNPVNEQRLRDAIAGNLTSRGLVRAAQGATPDCLVSQAIGARTMIQDDPVHLGFGMGWGWGRRGFGGFGWNDTYAYREGRISVDLFDGATREPLWHGSVQLDVTRLSGQEAQQRIDAAVQALFAKFPPFGTGT